MKLGESKLIPSSCPNCGARHDATTHISTDDPRASPEPGDVCVCIECAHLGQWQIIDGTLTVIQPTPEARREMLKDPVIRKVLEAVRQL